MPVTSYRAGKESMRFFVTEWHFSFNSFLTSSRSPELTKMFWNVLGGCTIYFLIKALENHTPNQSYSRKKTKITYIPDTHVCIFIDFYYTSIPTVYPGACVHLFHLHPHSKESLSINETAAFCQLNHPWGVRQSKHAVQAVDRWEKHGTVAKVVFC